MKLDIANHIVEHAILNLEDSYVPYIGAVKDVDLGAYNFTTTGTGTFGGLELENTITSSTGVINKNTVRFLHNFNYPTTVTGKNTFLGEGAGNFTMGSTGTFNYHASYNTVVGADAFVDNVKGYCNTVIGFETLTNNTEGFGNVAIGASAMHNSTEANYNVVIGLNAGYYLRQNECVLIGYQSLGAASSFTSQRNTAVGSWSGYSVTTGNTNVFVGYKAGNHASQLSSADNSIGIGANSYTNSDNQAVIGDSSITETLIGRGDNNKLLFGAAQDASITYDGTNMVINPQEVGSGILDVLGTLQTDGYNSSDGSAGITQSETGVTNFDIVIKDGLITSFTKN